MRAAARFDALSGFDAVPGASGQFVERHRFEVRLGRRLTPPGAEIVLANRKQELTLAYI